MNRIVIRAPNHLGDALMAKGAIKAFVDWSPDSEAYILLPEWALPIYRDIERLNFLPMSKKYLHGFGAVISQVRLLKKNRFYVGVVLTPSFSSALILSLAGIKSRYGYDGERRGLLLNNKISAEGLNGMHRSERYRKLLERVAGHNLKAEKPSMTISERVKEETVELLKSKHIDPCQSFMTLAPQAVAESRRWGSANYAELARKVGLPVVLVGTAAEYDAGQKIAGHAQHIVNLCGRTDIESAGAVLAMARVFVGNDSGLAHMAAAVATPLVVLSGADKPSETSPLSDNKIVIIKDHLECISCVKNDCRLKGEAFMQCMKLITVDEVYGAVQRLT